MRRLENNSARAKVLTDPELRQVYYEESKRSKAERAAYEDQEEEEKRAYMQRFYRRTNYTPPEFRPDVNLLEMTAVEAWIFEHPSDDPANATTRGEMHAMIAMQRLRGKGTKLRLREIGIH